MFKNLETIRFIRGDQFSDFWKNELFVNDVDQNQILCGIQFNVVYRVVNFAEGFAKQRKCPENYRRFVLSGELKSIDFFGN